VAGLAVGPIAALFLEVKLVATHPVLMGESRGAPDSVVSFLERQPGQWRFFVEELQRAQGDHAFLHKAGMMNRLFAVPDYEPSVPADYSQLLKGKHSPLWHAGKSVLSNERTPPASALAKLLDLMSVRFYVALDTQPTESLQKLAAFVRGRHHDLGDAHVFERRSALPRAYAVREVLLEPDVASAIERTTRQDFRPRDMAVVVDAEMDSSHFADLQGRRLVRIPRRDTAQVLRYETDAVEIEAECEQRCLLVSTDLFYPGWRVAVDGEKEEIHRVNGLYRGVVLGPGHHRILYRFRPLPFRVGIVLFCVSLAGAAALVAVGPLRERMRGRAREPVS
jgi:hypothetical protein